MSDVKLNRKLTLEELITSVGDLGESSDVDINFNAAADFDLSPITVGACSGEFQAGLDNLIDNNAASIVIDWPQVFAAGNDYTYGGDVNFDGIINSRYTVSVGAMGKNGLRK